MYAGTSCAGILLRRTQFGGYMDKIFILTIFMFKVWVWDAFEIKLLFTELIQMGYSRGSDL